MNLTPESLDQKVKSKSSPGGVAIAWTLRNPAVTGAIVGARNASQAEDVMLAGELALSDEDVSEIESFSKPAA